MRFLSLRTALLPVLIWMNPASASLLQQDDQSYLPPAKMRGAPEAAPEKGRAVQGRGGQTKLTHRRSHRRIYREAHYRRHHLRSYRVAHYQGYHARRYREARYRHYEWPTLFFGLF